MTDSPIPGFFAAGNVCRFCVLVNGLFAAHREDSVIHSPAPTITAINQSLTESLLTTHLRAENDRNPYVTCGLRMDTV